MVLKQENCFDATRHEKFAASRVLKIWFVSIFLMTVGIFLSILIIDDYIQHRFLGGFLLGRTLAAVMTVTLSSSMAARQGTLAMAAHQICLQVWLSASLLVDAQAAAAQVSI